MEADMSKPSRDEPVEGAFPCGVVGRMIGWKRAARAVPT